MGKYPPVAQSFDIQGPNNAYLRERLAGLIIGCTGTAGVTDVGRTQAVCIKRWLV